MRKRALVVERSAIMRKIVVRVLQSLGVRDSFETCDGSEAITKFQTEVFDLVILEPTLDSASGLEVVRAIRAGDEMTPIVVMAKEEEVDLLEEMMAAGANGALEKPFTSDALRELCEPLVRAMA